MWFVKQARRKKPRRLTLIVIGEAVPVQTEMKYLGVTLDSRLTFGSHFARVAPKIERVANFLRRLLPNVSGPGLKVRSLYMGVAKSIAL